MKDAESWDCLQPFQILVFGVIMAPICALCAWCVGRGFPPPQRCWSVSCALLSALCSVPLTLYANLRDAQNIEGVALSGYDHRLFAGEYEDCDTVWPTTTTTEEVGCCYSGDGYKANDKGSRATNRARCEDMGCEFLMSDDPDDCIMTTISTPSTTEEVGCCYGEGVKASEKRGNKVGRDQCERSGKCEFCEGEDADYDDDRAAVDVATWPRREMCADKIGRDNCECSCF